MATSHVERALASRLRADGACPAFFLANAAEIGGAVYERRGDAVDGLGAISVGEVELVDQRDA